MEQRGGGEFADAVVRPGRADAKLAGGTELAPHHPSQQLEGERQVFGVDQALKRPADPFVATPAGDRLERRVEGRDGPLGREREDNVPDAFDQRAEALFRLPQRRFGGATLRHVAEVHHDRPYGGLGEAVDGDRLDVAPGAVGVMPAELERRGRPGAPGDGVEYGRHPREVVGVHTVEGVVAHQVGRCDAQQAGDRRAGEQQGAVGGDEGDRVGGMLDEGAEALLALPAGLLGPRLLLAGAPQVERPEDRGPQAFEVVLHHVVRGSGLDVFRRGLFVEAARDNHDRGAGRFDEGDAERGGGTERGEGVVGEDDIGCEGAQRLPVRPLGLDAARRGVDSGTPQFLLDQRRVVRYVLNDQDAHQGGRHVSGAARSTGASTARPRIPRARRPRSRRA